jgi:hypothetical protein
MLFGGSVRGREARETRELHERVEALFRAHPLGRTDKAALVEGLLGEAFDDLPEGIIRRLAPTARTVLGVLIDQEGLLDLPAVRDGLGMEEGARLRALLRRKERFYADPRLFERWREIVVGILGGVLLELPDTVLLLPEDGESEPVEASLIDLCEAPGEVVQRVLATILDDDAVREAGLFPACAERLWHNVHRASGIDPDKAATTRKAIVTPEERKDLAPLELVETYLGGTPFSGYLREPLPFPVPLQSRFEHTHVLGGTGHGKTQLLLRLIHRDLLRARDGGCGVVVIDSQGDLIRTISHLALFDPEAPGSLADRLVLIDPTDVEHPPSLNLFDCDLDRLRGHDPAAREMILNGTVALFEYVFGALLGAELTQKQGVIFRYLARLMTVIPGATIHTLLDLMEEPRLAAPHLDKLDGLARRFFEREFPQPNFDDTRQQIRNRLWGVLANPVLERMFAGGRNAVDLFAAMNEGKIILVNTAKDLLKRDGCAILGRFFVAMVGQAAIERATVPPERRRPTFVYVDEAHEYFDDRIEELLNQARKYRVGLVLAHQNLDQLDQRLRGTVMASTSVKFAGGVSAKDAAVLAREMRCEPEFLISMRKRDGRTEFALWVKHATPHAIQATIPLGEVDLLPRLSPAGYAALIDGNRVRYCRSLDGRAIPSSPNTRGVGKSGFTLGEQEVL